jgi:hypothetical protein
MVHLKFVSKIILNKYHSSLLLNHPVGSRQWHSRILNLERNYLHSILSITSMMLKADVHANPADLKHTGNTMQTNKSAEETCNIKQK